MCLCGKVVFVAGFTKRNKKGASAKASSLWHHLGMGDVPGRYEELGTKNDERVLLLTYFTFSSI